MFASGNILVVPRSVELTLDLTDRSSRFGYIEHICSLGAYIVITKVPRYLANARPADSFRSLGSATSTCAIFAAQQVLTAQEIRMLGRDNNFTATLVVDENDYIKFFRWIPFQIIYKGALGAAYLATGVLFCFLCLSFSRVVTRRVQPLHPGFTDSSKFPDTDLRSRVVC